MSEGEDLYKDEDRLRRLFHEEGLTQSEIAEKLGCSHGTVSNWMRKYGIETRKEKEYKCDCCGNSFREYPSQVTSEFKFCSMDCQAEWQSEHRTGENAANWSGGKETFECDNCGTEFDQWGSKLRWDKKLCSPECRIEASKKKDSPIYYGKDWPKIAERLVEKVGVCQAKGCEKTVCDNGDRLHVHHLKPVREFENPEDAHFKDNMVVLCAKHHQRIEPKDDQRSLIQ